jgi:hypothetical protein
MSLDFSNAELPRLLPLENSYAENDVEADLKALFLDLFRNMLAPDVFDVNVLGAAHLGSFDLVRQSVNTDGLVLLQGDREEAATRYLYRAWKSGNVQGRGLHFLRTYLQMLFPNECEVEQLWHDKNEPYPTAMRTKIPSLSWWLHQVGEPGLKLDGAWGIGRPIEDADPARADREIDTRGMFLTSRILISLGFDVNTTDVSKLIQVIKDVIPARLVPEFRFWLNATFNYRSSASFSLWMEKLSPAPYPWCGRVISDDPARMWKLGIDGAIPTISDDSPVALGTFKVGHAIGGKSNWHLRNCRASGALGATIEAEATTWRVETLPLNPEPRYSDPRYPTKLYRRVRRLNGAWQVGSGVHLDGFPLDGSEHLGSRKMSESPNLGTFKIRAYQPPVLLPFAPSRLTLSGNWKLGANRMPTFELYRIEG